MVFPIRMNNFQLGAVGWLKVLGRNQAFRFLWVTLLPTHTCILPLLAAIETILNSYWLKPVDLTLRFIRNNDIF
jgi:hypothetical protein